MTLRALPRLWRDRAGWVFRTLDVAAMREAADRGFLNATDLAAAAAQIFRLLSPDRPVPTVAVLDHRAEPFDALWAHERVEAALATTGEAADVLFWVVGLQDQYLAGTRARSTRWRAVYDEAVDTVQGLVARQAGPDPPTAAGGTPRASALAGTG